MGLHDSTQGVKPRTRTSRTVKSSKRSLKREPEPEWEGWPLDIETSKPKSVDLSEPEHYRDSSESDSVDLSDDSFYIILQLLMSLAAAVLLSYPTRVVIFFLAELVLQTSVLEFPGLVKFAGMALPIIHWLSYINPRTPGFSKAISVRRFVTEYVKYASTCFSVCFCIFAFCG